MTELTDQRRQIVNPGTISRTLSRMANLIKWLLLSLLFSIVVEWIGMCTWWEDDRLDHSRQMLATELSYLENDFKRSLITSDPVSFAKYILDQSHHVLFELTGFVDFLSWLSPVPTAQEEGVRPILHKIYQPMSEFILAAMQVTQVFSVRLVILLLATPVFALFGLVAVVEGLVRRDLRRWGGGRESSFVYHYAKKVALPLIVLAWVAYLSLPFSLHPSFVILPFAICFALTVAITASTFKKYL